MEQNQIYFSLTSYKAGLTVTFKVSNFVQNKEITVFDETFYRRSTKVPG